MRLTLGQIAAPMQTARRRDFPKGAIYAADDYPFFTNFKAAEFMQ